MSVVRLIAGEDMPCIEGDRSEAAIAIEERCEVFASAPAPTRSSERRIPGIHEAGTRKGRRGPPHRYRIGVRQMSRSSTDAEEAGRNACFIGQHPDGGVTIARNDGFDAGAGEAGQNELDLDTLMHVIRA